MSTVLFHTRSLCPVCLKTLEAAVTEDDHKVYLEKQCRAHGVWKTLIWSDSSQYLAWMNQSVHEQIYPQTMEQVNGCPHDCGLCKAHEGLACTAVLEITKRCNLHCPVCFADVGRESYDLDLDTIRRMYDGAFRAGGNISVQISGGEPTVREDLPEILRIGKEEKGFSHIQVNTNGIRLAQEPGYAAKLKEAGADLIYLQFDSLRDEVYRKTRGRDLLDIKKQAIENCAGAGLGVMLVPVIIKGLNDSEIGDLVRFAISRIPAVKGIHFQPISYFGRFPNHEGKPDWDPCNLSDVVRALIDQTGGEMRPEDFMPRKKYDAHCSFSAAYYLDEAGTLRPLTVFRPDEPATGEEDFSALTNVYTNRFWRAYEPTEGCCSVPPTESSSCTEDSAEEACCEASETSCCCCGQSFDPFQETGESGLDRLIRRIREYSFSVTGMGFQDVYSIDLTRLKGCCVMVIEKDGRAIPLCAYHLTGETGMRLYGKN